MCPAFGANAAGLTHGVPRAAGSRPAAGRPKGLALTRRARRYAGQDSGGSQGAPSGGGWWAGGGQLDDCARSAPCWEPLRRWRSHGRTCLCLRARRAVPSWPRGRREGAQDITGVAVNPKGAKRPRTKRAKRTTAGLHGNSPLCEVRSTSPAAPARTRPARCRPGPVSTSSRAAR